MRVSFEFTGTMPLLMHADDIEWSDRLQEWRKRPENKNVSVPGDDRSPPWGWMSCLYSDGEHLAIPSGNISAGLRSAGARLIMKKQKTFKEATQSELRMDGEFCDLFVEKKQIKFADLESLASLTFAQQAEAVQKHGFRLFLKRARIGTSKHVRVRPRFNTWTVRGSLETFAPELTFEVLTQLFEIGGKLGLCDWRPGCKTSGPFGMFTSKLTKTAS